jgi:hypothetical protein
MIPLIFVSNVETDRGNKVTEFLSFVRQSPDSEVMSAAMTEPDWTFFEAVSESFGLCDDFSQNC